MEKVKPLFIKPIEAAALLGVGKSKLYSMLARGEIPSRKISGMILVPLEALERLAADSMSQPDPGADR